MVYIVCGISGCGKSSIAKRLADKLGLPFRDGDNYHTEANKLKMRNGVPLEDEDRWPWLKSIKDDIVRFPNAVFACSALKKKYREFLAQGLQNQIVFIFLSVTIEILRNRLECRKDHFFNPNLLNSQLIALEVPTENESSNYSVFVFSNDFETADKSVLAILDNL